MPTYISLMSWTQKGIENVKESPVRLDHTKEAFKAVGAEIKAFYLVNGRYDAIVVAEASSDEVIAKLFLTIGSQGSIRTETVRAYTEAEYRKLIDRLAYALTVTLIIITGCSSGKVISGQNRIDNIGGLPQVLIDV